MSRIRLASWLSAVILMLTAIPAAAQFNDNVQMFGGNWEASGNKWQPFGPTGFEMDAEPFAIRLDDEYGGADAFSQGPYFIYNKLNWSSSRPDKRPLGSVTPVEVSADGRVFFNQINGHEAAVRNAPFHWGNRFDMGYWDGKTGWGASVLDLDHQLQATLDVQVAVNFADPTGSLQGFVDADANGFDDDLDGDGQFGRFLGDATGNPTTLAPTPDLDDLVTFPTIVQELITRNQTEVSGVELMKMYRFRPFHYSGTIFELSLGARYMEVNDQFQANALGGFTNQFANLGQETDPNTQQQVPVRVRSFWFNEVDNNIIGPQIGGRFYNRRGPWNFIAEGRFLAGFNFQNVKQRGQIGGNIPQGVVVAGNQNVLLTNAPVALDNSNFFHAERFEEFSPLGELRIQTSYNVTEAVGIQVGWSMIYSAGIARAANMIEYTAPHLGIARDNREDFITTGVDFGVVWNR